VSRTGAAAGEPRERVPSTDPAAAEPSARAEGDHGREADRRERAEALRRRAIEVRLRDLDMVHGAGMGHLGGEFSAIDILVTLYFGGVLRHDPTNPTDPTRDRFVLSKGHSAAALYTTLAVAGYFDLAELDTWLAPMSRLNGHPDRNKLPGIETNTGPLGHGFPVAVGIALSGQLDAAERRTFVLTGDGELQEGSMWEAAMAAGHFGLDRLVCIVDRNRLQQGDRTELTMGLDPLPDKFRAFGWSVRETDGHDHAALLETFETLPFEGGKPNCIIANTVKGRGVSFMQDDKAWHHRVVSDQEYEQAVAELEAAR
jgi:transketolase